MNDKAYDEVGANYRFFLRWRHASFAGMLVVLFGTFQLTFGTLKDQPRVAWLIPLFASPLGFLLWIVDMRTRDLYHCAIRAGKTLEGASGGFYSELSTKVLSEGASSFSRLTQSLALNVLFLGSSAALIILGFVLRGNWFLVRDPLLWIVVAAVAASFSALSASVYTWLTFRLVRSLGEPNVVIYVRHDQSRRSILQIVVENIGRGLATDLRFTSSRPIPNRAWGLPGDSIQDAQPMTNGPLIDGIRTLGPGDSRTISWGQYAGLKKALGAAPIGVTCEYRHGTRSMPTISATLEVDSFSGTDALESEGARTINELQRIADATEKLAGS